MEIIPLLHVKNRKIRGRAEKRIFSLNDLSKLLNSEKKVYITDTDGIKSEKPNINLYQKISEKYTLWIDAGPRNIGDIVDFTMAGATMITIRRELFNEQDLESIKEIVEAKIYIDVNLQNHQKNYLLNSISSNIDGIIVFPDKNQINTDFKLNEKIKMLCRKYNTYIAESDKKKASYWKTMGAVGILTDAENLKTF